MVLFFKADKDLDAFEYQHNWIIPSFSLSCKLLLCSGYSILSLTSCNIMFQILYFPFQDLTVFSHKERAHVYIQHLCKPTLSTENWAIWSPGLLLHLYLGAAVQEYPNPLWGATLCRVQDPKAQNQIGSGRLYVSSILPSVAGQHTCRINQETLKFVCTFD